MRIHQINSGKQSLLTYYTGHARNPSPSERGLFHDKYLMRLREFAQQADVRAIDNAIDKAAQPPAKMPANLTNVLKYLAKGDWRAAILAGAITMAPELKPYLTPEQNKVLKYAVNTYGAANFWTGLSTFASRIGVPFLSLAGWSADLNSNEQDELERRRQMGPTVQKN